jgi:hypothetical protein
MDGLSWSPVVQAALEVARRERIRLPTSPTRLDLYIGDIVTGDHSQERFSVVGLEEGGYFALLSSTDGTRVGFIPVAGLQLVGTPAVAHSQDRDLRDALEESLFDPFIPAPLPTEMLQAILRSAPCSTLHGCPICHDDEVVEPGIPLQCGHVFHTTCVEKWAQEGHTCPVCRAALQPQLAAAPAPNQCEPSQDEALMELPEDVPLADIFRPQLPTPVSIICTCTGRRQGAQGRHRIGCPLSAQQHSVRTTVNDPLGSPSQAAIPHVLVRDTGDWPSPDEVARRHIPTLQHVPQDARVTVARSLERVLRRCSVGDDHAGWWELFLWPKCILARPTRGGHRAIARSLMQRCAAWQRGNVRELWDAACSDHPIRDPLAQPALTTVDEELDLPFELDTLGDDTTEASRDALTRVTRLVRAGQFSRAMTAAAATRPLPPTAATVAMLQELHPRADPPLPVDILEPPPDGPTPSQLKRLLRGFKPGSGAGPSGLRASVLVDLLKPNATDLATHLAQAVTSFVRGEVPVMFRPFFFGACLTGLPKRTPGVRPVACGEVLRRCGGRHLCRSERRSACAFFEARKQMAFSPGGAEVVFHGTRRYARHLMAHPELRKVILKLDCTNGFNLAKRTKFLTRVATALPSFARYAQAAYGQPTHLYVGDYVILSEDGSQQGDPPGPHFFAVDMAELMEDRPPVPLDLEGFFLDDGTLGGDVEHVVEVVEYIVRRGPEFGIHLNIAKCEVIAADHSIVEGTVLSAMQRKPLDGFTLLGGPIGTPEFIAAHVEKVVAKASERMRFISCMECSHEAFALLRYTVVGMPVFYSRTAGNVGPLGRFFDAMMETFAALVTPVPSDTEVLQVSLPTRHAGLGLRDPRQHAAIAAVCSVSAAARSANLICSMTASLPEDVLLATSLACPTLAHFPSVLEKATEYAASGRARFGDGMQRKLSHEIEDLRFESLKRQLSSDRARADTERDLARLTSCSRSGASLYLTMPFVGSTTARVWLPSADFSLLVRRRLGQHLLPQPTPCGLCRGRVAVDTLGDHGLRCMAAGAHTMLHHELVTMFHHKASAALLHSRREACPFSSSPTSRVDTFLLRTHPRPTACDVAVTDSLQSRATMASAARTPGGHATAYEQRKRDRYGALCEEDGFALAPLVADTFGAWGDTALVHFRTIAKGLVQRFGEPYVVVHQQLMMEANIILMRGLARSLRMAMATSPPSLQHQPDDAAEPIIVVSDASDEEAPVDEYGATSPSPPTPPLRPAEATAAARPE